MASRRRAVERAASRRTSTDRVVSGVLVVVAASGLMSVLPGASQRAVSQTACRVASLGLGTCGDTGLDLTDAGLAPPRCRVLAALDDALPEVRQRRLVAARGLPVTISTARSGDMVVELGDAPQPPPPDVLSGAVRPPRPIAAGVSVPAQAAWYLPRGQGLDELVGAVEDAEHSVVQRRSALGLVGAVLDRDERSVPPPTLLVSRLNLRQPIWPAPSGQSRPGPTGSWMQVRTERPAISVFNRIAQESALVADLTGTLGGRPVSGTLRLTRDASGTVTSILLAVVTDGPILGGEAVPAIPGPAVAYVHVPVQTAPERDLVAAWLAGTGPVVVPLDGLLGLKAPPADDQLDGFLTRAATVTVLRYAGVTTEALADRVAGELRDGRRQDWAGVRLTDASEVDPTSSGAGRRPVVDPVCRT